MNLILRAALAGMLATTLSVTALAAPPIRVDFDVDNTFGVGVLPAFAGHFIASDTNGDGVISYSEVTSFYSNALGYAPLEEFGDFDIADNLWTLENAARNGYSNMYWVQALADGSSTYLDGIRPETTASAVSVPEPDAVWLMLAGLVVTTVWRRRR